MSEIICERCNNYGYSDDEVGAFKDGYQQGRAEHRGRIMNKILFSQLIALISASFETNKIQIRDGYLAWCNRPIKEDELEHSHNLSIKWKRSGYIDCYLCMTLDGRLNKNSSSFYDDYYFSAFYFYGDNCHDRTRFLFELMANETMIIDDLGIVEHGGEIGKTYLTNLKHSDYASAMVNARGKKVIFKNGKWIYKEQLKEQK